MQDPNASESEPQIGQYPAQQLQDPQSRVQPSSSRMLMTYLADVERNLDEQRWDLALRDAFDLPQIAVALTDPQLRSSSERCRAWCAEWIRPGSAANDSGADHERICRILGERMDHDPASASESVPSLALRRLRLRRHARNPPSGFSSGHIGATSPDAADAVEICTALVEGARRWYAHTAVHNATAQANLARLAVLR